MESEKAVADLAKKAAKAKLAVENARAAAAKAAATATEGARAAATAASTSKVAASTAEGLKKASEGIRSTVRTSPWHHTVHCSSSCRNAPEPATVTCSGPQRVARWQPATGDTLERTVMVCVCVY